MGVRIFPSRLGRISAMFALFVFAAVATASIAFASPASANDEFSSPTIITTFPFRTSQDTSIATAAADDPLLPCHNGTRGSNTVWFSFTPTTRGVLNVNTAGSNYDTILAIWRGTRGSLINTTCNDDYGPGLTSQTFAVLTPRVTYYIEVADVHSIETPRTGGSMNLDASFTPIHNLLLNPSFEQDANGDLRPDNWTAQGQFTRTPATFVDGRYSALMQATNNGSVTVRQLVTNLTGGQTYYLSGYVRVPQTVQGLSLTVSVVWRTSGVAVRQDVLMGISGPTGGWFPVNTSAVAPPSVTGAQILVQVTNLTGRVYLDSLNFGN